MITRNEIERLTRLYWMTTGVKGIEPGSAAYGMRYGIVIALSQPNYARLYAEATHSPSAAQFEEEAIKEFVAAVPLGAEGNGA